MFLSVCYPSISDKRLLNLMYTSCLYFRACAGIVVWPIGNENAIWCVNIGKYMAFESIVGSDTMVRYGMV